MRHSYSHQILSRIDRHFGITDYAFWIDDTYSGFMRTEALIFIFTHYYSLDIHSLSASTGV